MMFEYFPGNYVWNMSVVATLNSGGLIDEVDRACRPLRELAAQGADVGTRELMAAWAAVADQLEAQAAEAEKDGHRRSAGQKYGPTCPPWTFSPRLTRVETAGEPLRGRDRLLRAGPDVD
ncbi:hypothetical protein FAGKG844_280028 [Frankia sp. AgKG'84/4]|nr:hypothetical protein [Frankia sp. AgKG'84/4]MCL9792984.1 hypothetical protein [Frankia sp. AgKG'84/4]